MKTRRVIGRVKVENCVIASGKKLVVDDDIFDDIPVNTEIELAVYEDIPPKRRLIVPEGVLIVRDGSLLQPAEYHIILGSEHIGDFAEDGTYVLWSDRKVVRLDDPKYSYVFEPTKQAAFEKLADLGWHGFHYEAEEPDWSKYKCFQVTYRHDNGEWSARFDFGSTGAELIKARYKDIKQYADVVLAILEGRTADGQVDVLDRWSRVESEDKNV